MREGKEQVRNTAGQGALGGEARFPWSQCSVADERDLHSLGGLKAIIGQLMLCYHADFSIDFWLNSTC